MIENTNFECEEVSKKEKYIDLEKMGDAPIVCWECDYLFGIYSDEYEDIAWLCGKGIVFNYEILPPCKRR